MNAPRDAKVSAPIADLDSDHPIGEFAEGARLVGTRCNACGTTMLGNRVVCSTCVSTDVARVALPATGSLYSFTRLHVGGDGVRPLGYVDLDGVEVRTLADLDESNGPVQLDGAVRLVVTGDAWAFAPIASN
ncbi:Zn-ribbon domain-containing OB-fold protein [Leucobacter luti]|uniref:Uncharacterized protein n=1 Tax=Leucobacter luti TaxID=340320 RepID=A0A4Q7U3X7_9MICO|nr:OB-fold domain-containing protein [Leucobacter luti]MBL3699536.1 hypothetical protein [Leucobacter luti]RZT67048.1 hypothetical protein EV139_1180 [Leucobacter luti]